MAVLLAAPSAAEMTPSAPAITWTATGPLEVVNEARDAILWERGNRAFMGAIFTAALPNLSAIDNGDGSGTLRIVMPRTAAEAWLTQFAATGCGESPTQQQILDCADAAILADVKSIVVRYEQAQVPPPEAVDLQ